VEAEHRHPPGRDGESIMAAMDEWKSMVRRSFFSVLFTVDDCGCSMGLNVIHGHYLGVSVTTELPRDSVHVFGMLVLLSVLVAFLSSESFNTLSVPNASAVSTTGNPIGVYWNQAATNSCVSIFWGKLAPGGGKSFVLYVRNEGDQSLYYLLTSGRWNPVGASQYLSLRWSYDGSRMSPGSVLRVSLTLAVSRAVWGVTDFSFDVVILASPNLLGDVDFNGRVEILDLSIIARAFGSSLGSPGWNPNADVNADGRVDIMDLALAAKNFGKTG